MSFFDMYPMGGMNVGGFPVGGAYDNMMYGSALTEAQKAQRAQTRFANRDIIQENKIARKADEVRELMKLQRMPQYATLPLSVLRALAKASITNQRKVEKASRPAAVRSGGPRKGLGQFIMVDGKRMKNPNYQPPTGLAFQRSRLTNANIKKKGTTPAQLEALVNFLDTHGFGITDLGTGEIMEGGAWYDDLLSGVKDVASVAAPFLPLLL